MSYLAEKLHISKTEFAILHSIAKRGERAGYDLWKKDKVARSNKTVSETLKKLVQRKFIQPKMKTIGTQKKPYIITTIGLMVILTYNEIWKDIDKIAEKQREKSPLIFGKWKLLKKLEITDLLYAVNTNDFSGMILEEEELGKDAIAREQQGFMDIYNALKQVEVGSPFLLTEENLYLQEVFRENKELISKFKQDKDINRFITDALQLRLKTARMNVEIYEKKLEQWSSLKI